MSWADLLVKTLRLTDEVEKLNGEVKDLKGYVVEVDKRIVRIETMVEIADFKNRDRQLESD